MDYARVSRRSLRRRNETVGTNYAGDTASGKGDGRDALRAGMAEDTASAKRDGRDPLRTGMAEDTASAK